MTEVTADDNNIVTAKYLVTALRDNGYRNAATALAELADNSIQAGATRVELLCAEDEVIRTTTTRALSKIAVLDNGKGMSAAEIRQALRFGVGTHHEDPDGMGKFGMGLPSASISQCRRVEVWSWTKDPKEACYTYLDIDEIASGTSIDVPEPVKKKIPKMWRDASAEIGTSGTLVVWSNIDKCVWKTANALIKNSEYLIGRMYRKFIADGSVTIRLAAFLEGSPSVANPDRLALANDPGYLMQKTSTPEPFANEPMFEAFGDMNEERNVKFTYKGKEYPVMVRYSLARNEARKELTPGSLPHGKHAARNVGVSVVRAGRELNLEQAFTNPDPTERWWGVEIEFPPALDEIFGVTNNKQVARNLGEVFAEIAAKEGEGYQEPDEEDWRKELFVLVNEIKKMIRNMRRAMDVQTKNKKQGKNSQRYEAEASATKATTGMLDSQLLTRTPTDVQFDDMPLEERQAQLKESLVLDGVDREDAHILSSITIDLRLKYVFIQSPLPSSAFFEIQPVAGEIVVKLNTDHPVFEHLLEVLTPTGEQDDSAEALKYRLEKASIGLKVLLLAWARFEDDQVGAARSNVQDLRTDWGKMARKFLTEPSES